jgi:hypothetical protein
MSHAIAHREALDAALSASVLPRVGRRQRPYVIQYINLEAPLVASGTRLVSVLDVGIWPSLSLIPRAPRVVALFPPPDPALHTYCTVSQESGTVKFSSGRQAKNTVLYCSEY